MNKKDYWTPNEIYIRKNGQRNNPIGVKIAKQSLKLKIKELYDVVVSRAEESPLSPGRRYRKLRKRPLYRCIFLVACVLNVCLMLRSNYYCRNSTNYIKHVPIPARGQPSVHPGQDHFSDPSRIPPPPTHHLHGVTHSAPLSSEHLPGGPADPKWQKRLVFIGDIHGCMQELKALLSKFNYNAETDHIVHTGDVIGKGPDSAAVVDFLIEAQASGVRGNWEDRVILANRTLYNTTESSSQAIDGTVDTTKAGLHHSGHNSTEAHVLNQLSPHHLAYLLKLPIMLTIPIVPGSQPRWYSNIFYLFGLSSLRSSTSRLGHDTKSNNTIPKLPVLRDPIVVVHAGLIPAVPLDHQDPLSAMTMRYVNRNNYLTSERILLGGVEWWKVWSWWQNKLAHPDPVTHQAVEDKRSPVLQNQQAVYVDPVAQSLALKEKLRNVKERKAIQAAVKAADKLKKQKKKQAIQLIKEKHTTQATQEKDFDSSKRIAPRNNPVEAKVDDSKHNENNPLSKRTPPPPPSTSNDKSNDKPTPKFASTIPPLSAKELIDKSNQKDRYPTRQQQHEQQYKLHQKLHLTGNSVAAQVAHRNAVNRAANVAGWTRPADHVSGPDRSKRRPEEIPTFVIHGHNTNVGARLDDQWSVNLDGGCAVSGTLIAMTLDAWGRREVFVVQCRRYTS